MQPTSVPGSLNLEYFLVRLGDWAQAFNVGGWPHGLLLFIEDVYVIGMTLSLLMIVLVVYVMIRLHQVEHEGFHELEMREHEAHGEVEAHGGNDRWENIVALAYGATQGDWRRAILEADIMLFDVLAEQGYPGETVGDQLKGANPIQMTTLDLAWAAHKTRNDVAHQGEQMQLSERDVRATVDAYRRVFEEFGVL